MKRILSSSFGSAVAGGLVVAAVGLGAIEAGWVGDGGDSGGATTAPAGQANLVSNEAGRSDSGGSDDGLSVGEIYERDAAGVAFIRAGQASGSGFVIDNEGHILTNAHVVEGAKDITVEVGEDGEQREATLVGADPSSDVALLDVDESDDLTALELGDSGTTEVGDPVVAIGNPFGLDRTVTSGIVSAKQRQIQAPNGFSISDVIQTDAAVNPGNSGGPLLDSGGRVIGINSQIASTSGANDGVAFAVPIATAKDVVDQLLDGGSVRRAYLGITGGDVTSEVAEVLDLTVERGAIVEQVFVGGPAADAGLEGSDGQANIAGQAIPSGGDVITDLNGEPIEGMEDVITAVNSGVPGDELKLTVVRDGEVQEISVTLGERPAQAEGAQQQAPQFP
ncbi:MAG: trypsin-like peptidase domain-containing protein [Solirubrobacterales bacterium]|nr:trypsin-like peptidase domain-containing protein [Solirubrobacterales bacterium]